jgi:hypothetical protein
LAKEISLRGLNCTLQIEADIISFWLFNPPSAPDGAARSHEPGAELVLFSAYPGTFTTLEISCQQF